MSLAAALCRLDAGAARVAGRLEDAFLLLVRVHVAWQFLKSGLLKLEDWETTRLLFEQEYRVPVLSPALAAVAGTAGELVFPALLVVGLLGRYAALGLFAVNAMAVVAYAHVLYGEGYEGALAQHWLWGFMLLTLVLFGPGRFSADGWLAHRAGLVRRRRERWADASP